LDSLTRSDVEISRATPAAEKLAQALELMQLGIRLKRDALRAKAPDASDDEIQSALERWLLSDDDAAAEALVYELGTLGYRALATVEHETRKRLSPIPVARAEELLARPLEVFEGGRLLRARTRAPA
jgi:Rv0078B-related antitoxin